MPQHQALSNGPSKVIPPSSAARGCGRRRIHRGDRGTRLAPRCLGSSAVWCLAVARSSSVITLRPEGICL